MNKLSVLRAQSAGMVGVLLSVVLVLLALDYGMFEGVGWFFALIAVGVFFVFYRLSGAKSVEEYFAAGALAAMSLGFIVLGLALMVYIDGVFAVVGGAISIVLGCVGMISPYLKDNNSYRYITRLTQ